MRNCTGNRRSGFRGFGSWRGPGGVFNGGRGRNRTERSENQHHQGGFYRSRNGKLLGVCQGVADYLDVRASRVRIVVVLGFLITGIWPVGVLYLVAAALMKPEPVVPFANDDEREFYDSYTGSRTGALSRLKRRFDNIDRRIRRMEDVVTSSDFEWEQKLRG